MPYRLCGDVYCFILGFTVAHFFKNTPPFVLTLSALFLSIIILLGEQITISNHYWDSRFVEHIVTLLWPWKKCLFGVAIFFVLYLPLFNKVSDNMAVNVIDKYSYEIYLCHKNFILGCLSLLYFSNFLPFNIFFSIICSLICAFLIYGLSRIIQNMVNTILNEPREDLRLRVWRSAYTTQDWTKCVYQAAGRGGKKGWNALRLASLEEEYRAYRQIGSRDPGGIFSSDHGNQCSSCCLGNVRALLR